MLSTALRGLISSKAHLHGSGVGFEAFGAGQCRDGRRQLRQRAAVELLDRDHLDVVGGGESSAQAGHAVGREDVVGPGGVVARGFGAVRADENAAGVADLREQFFVVNAQVFRGEGVRKFRRFIERIAR